MIQELSEKHQLSQGAIEVLLVALQRGNGTLAQFNHPDLGGMGQWMPGMIMIGDMNNHALKARIEAVCIALSQHLAGQPRASIKFDAVPDWWVAKFGKPAMSASQNGLRYAYFPEKNRLVIQVDNHLTEYDTTGFVITSVSAQNGILRILTKQGDRSPADFPVVAEYSVDNF